MRNITFLVLLTAIVFSAKAQATLQFNQVLLVTTTQSVPNGHVWKIESITYSSSIPDIQCPVFNNTGCTSANLDDQIDIGGTALNVRSFRSNTSLLYYYDGSSQAMTSELWQASLPMWLPAGTSLAADSGVAFINVMDFIVN